MIIISVSAWLLIWKSLRRWHKRIVKSERRWPLCLQAVGAPHELGQDCGPPNGISCSGRRQGRASQPGCRQLHRGELLYHAPRGQSKAFTPKAMILAPMAEWAFELTLSPRSRIWPGCMPSGYQDVDIKSRVVSAFQKDSSAPRNLAPTKVTCGTFNMNFIFPYTGNNNPNWLSYFSDALKPPTRKATIQIAALWLNMGSASWS